MQDRGQCVPKREPEWPWGDGRESVKTGKTTQKNKQRKKGRKENKLRGGRGRGGNGKCADREEERKDNE